MLDFQGKRITVMGLGRFGGGVGAVRFLAERGGRVTVTDLAAESDLAEPLAELDGCRIDTLRLGRHDERDFRAADLVVVSPAVPRSNRYLQIARDAGVPLTSEMSLFWQHNRGRTIGVTGSNGKSTTTALIHSILQASGRRAWLGGNIGRSLLPVVDEIGPDDWAVLELSSFQLEDLDRLKASPQIAVVTNFSPNHLDRHGTLDAYRLAKQSILRWQRPDDVAVLNRDDPDVSGWPTAGRRLCFGAGGEPALPLGEWLRLPGRHNLQNARAAACAALSAGVDAAAVRRGLEEYEPLPHRLQFVAEREGRRFYNDSLATTPESAIVALEAFTAPIVLLAGGYDKQVDLDALAQAIAGKVKAVALMGQTGPLLAERLARHASRPLPHRVCATFDEAFTWAARQSAPGDVVLLSPGCASYDWFRNFAHRGEQFAERVKSL